MAGMIANNFSSAGMAEGFVPLLPPALALLGLAFGSFLNVCIHRLPQGQSVVSPPSSCPHCRARIAWHDNIPVLSWLLLRGRCRRCHAPISPRYLVVELLASVLFLACYYSFGLSLEALKYAVFGFLLLGLIFTDAERQLLPDALTLPGLGLGLVFSVLLPVDGFAARLPGVSQLPFSSDLGWRLLSLLDSLLGAGFGASFIYGVGALYLRARPDLRKKGREAMGFGDVKLMAMVGAFLGVKLTIFTIFSASLAGSVFGLITMAVVWRKRLRRGALRVPLPATTVGAQGRRRAWRSAVTALRFFQVPFGVFLGSMAMVAAFVGDSAVRWYLHLYR